MTPRGILVRRAARSALGAGLLAAGLLLAAPNAYAQDVNLEEIFWCEEPTEEGEMTMDACAKARDAILFNCTSCHAFVPIVKAQKTEEEWNSTFETHADRLADVSEEDLELIRRYVVTHYNPDQPVPELPPALENLGTNQAY